MKRWNAWGRGEEGDQGGEEKRARSEGHHAKEGRIVGDEVEFGPEALVVEEDEKEAWSAVDFEHAVKRAIAAAEAMGPDQGGLVGLFDGDIPEPPQAPFECLTQDSRDRLAKAEEILGKGEELPAGPA